MEETEFEIICPHCEDVNVVPHDLDIPLDEISWFCECVCGEIFIFDPERG